MFALSDRDVDIWTISVPQCAAASRAFWPLLDAEERTRAERFVAPSDRCRYIFAHGAVRTILARYVTAEPAELCLRRSRYGKPALVPEPGWSDIRFNLSHSGDLALCAVSSGRRVGVDIERIDPHRAHLSSATEFLSAREVWGLGRLAKGDRVRGFFNCWTRKEAFIKGRGEGLSLCLAAFDVSLAPDEPAALLASRLDPDEVGRWQLRQLAVAEGYTAALAVESRGRSLVIRQRSFRAPDVP